MNLIAFLSPREIISIGLLEGEPTKGPLLRTINLQRPQRVLLLLHAADDLRALEIFRKNCSDGIQIEALRMECEPNESLSELVEALEIQLKKFPQYKDAGILNSGTPQERAALWVLKHKRILAGAMVNPPTNYQFSPAITLPELKIAEHPHFFEDANASASSLNHWSAVAAKIGCIGSSPRFRQTLEEASAMSGHPTPILLMGETGCGKEVVAHFIHGLSPRSDKPFVAVNCAALPETLAESILFGHAKGSFTGAYRAQKGKFEQATGGTLFLDELGELSLANQAKLLRALETRFVDPLGSSEPVKVDVRVIAATNRNLQQEVAVGRFREDLYYRLRAGEIEIPALRERASDIPAIALHLLERSNSTLAAPKQFSKAALKFLEVQRWPGNVRDLMNTIERAALLCPRTVIEPEDFRVAAEPIKAHSSNGLPALYQGFSMEAYLQKIRLELFEKALKQALGNKSEAARLLGISPQAIHKQLKLQEMRETNAQEA